MGDKNLKRHQGRYVRRQILRRVKKRKRREVVSVLRVMCVLPMAGGKILG